MPPNFFSLTNIGLISDTHGWLDGAVSQHFKACNEVWHAGDLGSVQVAEELEQQTGLPLRAVWGNIDGYDVRSRFPKDAYFKCEDVPVFITHIGGYPGRYAPGVKDAIAQHKPKLFICGHSHILKVMYDSKLQCLHMNPGAAGRHGWHTVRTLIRFAIDGADIKNCEVIELGKRGS